MAPRLSVRCTALLAAFAALAAAAPAPAAPVASSISLAASPNPASINGTVTVFGTLSESGGGGIAGKAIEIAVTPPGGSRTVRTTVTTGPIGQFSYADAIPFSVAGTYVYEAKWSGDATHAATTRTVAVAVLKQPATVSLTASPTVVDYNRQIAVTVGVGGAMSGTVSVYATPLGGVRTLVASGPVDASGTFRAPRRGVQRQRDAQPGREPRQDRPGSGDFRRALARRIRTSGAISALPRRSKPARDRDRDPCPPGSSTDVHGAKARRRRLEDARRCELPHPADRPRRCGPSPA